jgi:ABC-type bacteriocin/lantibiotic exporter with double-glycine peptidase domain
MRNPYVSLLRTAWSHARQQRGKFVLIYSMFAVANIIVALNPLFYGWFINELQQNGAEVLTTGWIYVGGFLLLRLVEWMFHGPARVMERQLAFRISRNFMDVLYHKVLHLPVQWHQDNHSGSTISRLQKSHNAMRDFFQSGFIYLSSFGKFIFSFAAMLYFSPLFGGIGILLGALTVWIIVQFDKPFIRSLRLVNEREHEVSSTLFDSLSNILTVITLRLEKRIQAGFMEKIGAVFPPFKKNVTINELKWFTAQMMVGLIYAVTTIGYIYQHYTPGETFLIGGLIILLGYVNQFTSVFNDIASHYTQIVKYDTEIQNVKPIENAYDTRKTKTGEEEIPSFWKSMEIRNLNFTRENCEGQRKAGGIVDLSMRIKRGQRIALIGQSGSGKSTLLSLLRGLHEPKPGTGVSVDDLNRIHFETISSTVTLFPQEPEIFENSIFYNITLGLPFSEEEVMKVCEAAQFADVVKQLPEGLHTHIQEKGVNLSGGQKQRLALARGILAAQNSSIVLMDEPTSSVDPRTERKIYASLFDAFSGKAIISSLHRLHLLKDFDYIYILHDGAVIDEGSFDNLSRYSLVFKEMWEHQASVQATEESYPSLNVAL